MKTNKLCITLIIGAFAILGTNKTAHAQTLDYSIDNLYVQFLVDNIVSGALFNLDFQVQVANGGFSNLNSFTVVPAGPGSPPINIDYNQFWIEQYSNNQIITWEIMFSLTTIMGNTYYEYRTGNITYYEYINNLTNEGPGGPIGPIH